MMQTQQETDAVMDGFAAAIDAIFECREALESWDRADRHNISDFLLRYERVMRAELALADLMENWLDARSDN